MRARTEPDATWLQITRALLIHQPDPGQPEPIGKLAARGLLDLMARTWPAGHVAQRDPTGCATFPNDHEE